MKHDLAPPVPPIVANAPAVVWSIDFQFGSTIDGKAIKIASTSDEHTLESLLNPVERSIAGENLGKNGRRCSPLTVAAEGPAPG